MSDYEIVRSYHEAKNKSKQIGILADLTLHSESDIVKILEDNGESVPTKKHKAKVNDVANLTKWTADMESKLRNGVAAHLPWEDIAISLNVPESAVRKKWYNMNKMNRPKHTPKPQEETAESVKDTPCPVDENASKTSAFGFDNLIAVLSNGEFDTVTFENDEVSVIVRRKAV